MVLNYYDYNISSFVYRNSEGSDLDAQGPVYLLMSKFVRPLPIIMWLAHKFYQRSRFNRYDVLPALCSRLISNRNPRFLAGTIYGTVIFVFSEESTRKDLIFFIVTGVVVLFPFLNLFRFENSQVNRNSSSMFLTTDFDTFSSICKR